MTELSQPRFFDRKTQPSMFTLVLLASVSMLAMNSFFTEPTGYGSAFWYNNRDHGVVCGNLFRF